MNILLIICRHKAIQNLVIRGFYRIDAYKITCLTLDFIHNGNSMDFNEQFQMQLDDERGIACVYWPSDLF